MNRGSVALLLLLCLLMMSSSVARGFSNNSPLQATNPPFYYNGGPVLSNSFLYVVFWGSDWTNYTDITQRLITNIQTLIQTGYFDGLAQYGYGSMSLIGSTINNVPLSSGQVPDETLIAYGWNLVTSGTIPKYNSQVMFVLPMRPDVYGGGSRDEYGGYHFGWLIPTGYGDKLPWGYDVIQAGTDYSWPQYNFLTTVVSHELDESITDPVPNTGWYGTGSEAEVGDLCESYAYGTEFAGVQVTNYWSTDSANCAEAQSLNNLETVQMSGFGLPVDLCAKVTWTTNLQTFQQPDCGSTPWTIRALLGTTISLSPNVISTNSSGQYVAPNQMNWTVTPGLTISATYVQSS